MKFYPKKYIVSSFILPNFTFIFILLFLATGYAQPHNPPGPPFPFPGGRKGQEAISALQDRLPQVASRYGKSAEELKRIFQRDKDLWLDPGDNLLYLCTFGDTVPSEPLLQAVDSAIPTGPFPLDQTFQLHSLAGASKVIYLDFDGHVTSNTKWNSDFNNDNNIVSVPYDFNGNTGSFSDTELGRIQHIWARVAEDFAMYAIDVTTEDPGVDGLRRNNPLDQFYGIRVVISPTSSWYGNSGGVAYVGSFNWNSDTPVFVFSDNLANGNEKYVTDTASHEAGHSLGLYHDGTTGGTEYYRGHGNWAPIMGAGFDRPITQWSKGEYAGANNTEDDLAEMLNYGASYRPDDHGDSIYSATILSGDILNASGIIEQKGDVDVFGFQAGSGNITINIDPADLDPNLDTLVQILDDGGNIINEADPYYILPASLDLNLPAGTYYLLIDGTGTGDPDTGYTDYASLGQYFISGALTVSDSDGDGFADDAEEVALSNPMDSDSIPVDSELQLQSGYNQVTFPAETMHYGDLQTLMEAMGGPAVIEKVLVFDRNTQQYVDAGYSDNVFVGTNLPLPAGEGLQGLIVFARQDNTINFTSQYCQTWNLKQGVNLVGSGGCIPAGLTALQLLADPALGAANVSSIQRFNPETGEFETRGFDENGNQQGIDFPIIPGEGYILNMKQAVPDFRP